MPFLKIREHTAALSDSSLENRSKASNKLEQLGYKTIGRLEHFQLNCEVVTVVEDSCDINCRDWSNI